MSREYLNSAEAEQVSALLYGGLPSAEEMGNPVAGPDQPQVVMDGNRLVLPDGTTSLGSHEAAVLTALGLARQIGYVLTSEAAFELGIMATYARRMRASHFGNHVRRLGGKLVASTGGADVIEAYERKGHKFSKGYAIASTIQFADTDTKALADPRIAENAHWVLRRLSWPQSENDRIPFDAAPISKPQATADESQPPAFSPDELSSGYQPGSHANQLRERGSPTDCAENPELFFPISMKDPRIASAKAICGKCAVMYDCRELALRRKEPNGIWGGLTAPERKALLTARAA